MADKKITDLPQLTVAEAGDLIPIVDSSANITKKVPASGIVPDGSLTEIKYQDGSVTPKKRSGGFWVGVHTFNNATGSQVITGPNFKVKTLLVTTRASANSSAHTATGIAGEAGAGIAQSATSTHNNRTGESGSAFFLANDTGGEFFRATVTSFGANGEISVTVNTSSGNASHRTWGLVALG